MYLLDDGHRRVTSLRSILADAERSHENNELTQEELDDHRARYGLVTVEVTHRALSLEERLKVWLLIHRERREWVLREREETAKSLVDLIGIRDAARFLGITEAAAQKL